MRIERAHSNVVVTGNLFNPSVFSQIWFVKNGFVKEQEMLPTSVFAPTAVQLNASAFQVVVIPPQLQFAPVGHEFGAVQAVLAPMIAKIPHTPFTGCGVNFVWTVHPEPEPFGDFTRRLFSRKDAPWASLDSPNARYGFYVSSDLPKSGRLKLDIKPLTVIEVATGHPKNPKVESLQFHFNFHLDVSPNDAVATVTNHFLRWNEFLELARKVLTSTIGIPNA